MLSCYFNWFTQPLISTKVEDQRPTWLKAMIVAMPSRLDPDR
jgi:hypothetical protein